MKIPFLLASPGYSCGPPGLRGTHSNSGTRSYGDPRVAHDLDAHRGVGPWTRCRDRTVTSQHSGTGTVNGFEHSNDNCPDADSGTGYPSPDADAGDVNTSVRADEGREHAGFHSCDTTGHPDRDADETHAITDADAIDIHAYPDARQASDDSHPLIRHNRPAGVEGNITGNGQRKKSDGNPEHYPAKEQGGLRDRRQERDPERLY